MATQADARRPKAIQPNHRTPVLSPFLLGQSVFPFDRRFSPFVIPTSLSSFRLPSRPSGLSFAIPPSLSSSRPPFRHSAFPLVIPASLSSFRRKPESRGRRLPPRGDAKRCGGVPSGDPLPSPPPKGEGILLSFGKRDDTMIGEFARTCRESFCLKASRNKHLTIFSTISSSVLSPPPLGEG